MRSFLIAAAAASFGAFCGEAFAEPLPGAGTCAIYGACGKKSLFGADLPCPYDGPAKEPETELRDKLVELCGYSWQDKNVCCSMEQVESLASNLAKADPLISSCPACRVNFRDFFCEFTCSPDQGSFLTVTKSQAPKFGGGDNKEIATQLSYYVDPEFGAGFYDSCKNVKFSGTNGFAMDLLGGGAKSYPEFLAFLGQERPLIGSPIQIDFPNKTTEKEITPVNPIYHPCNDSDPTFRCACVDCPGSCPQLAPVAPAERQKCRVGALPCFSFAVILISATMLAGVMIFNFVRALNARKEYHIALPEMPGFLGTPSSQEYSAIDARDVTGGLGDADDDLDAADYDPLQDNAKFYWLETVLGRMFHDLGLFCARAPALVFGTSVLVVGLLSIGWARFKVITDPVDLWVAPTSQAAKEKTFFDDNFGPFFRAEQAFIVNATNEGDNVLSASSIEWLFALERKVSDIHVEFEGKTLTLEDLCYNPTGDGCIIQSVTGYWGGDADAFDPGSWESVLKSCTSQPVLCLPPFQQPLKPNMILGEFSSKNLTAGAFVNTWVLSNSEDSLRKHAAEAWENEMIKLMKTAQSEAAAHGLRLSFMAEPSLEHELSKSTNSDAQVIVLSYVAMFIYASLALGGTLHYQGLQSFVESKFTLGMVGIMIVLASVIASVGINSMFGVATTMIIAEVIPFLVLAVGVDNIFLISHEFERVNTRFPDETIETRVARSLGRIGPSILLSTTAETLTFALGTFVGMPAVRNFALYATMAVLINALLQVTALIAVLTWDQRRVEAGRFDMMPCIQISRNSASHVPREGIVVKFFRKYYGPWLLSKRVKPVILALFAFVFTASLAMFPEVELGLDQRIAIPSDSYLIDYFNDMYRYFNSGPPVYFVEKHIDVTEREGQQKLCGRFTSCREASVANILEEERLRPASSLIADPSASWVDDFMSWLNPELDSCCLVSHENRTELCDPDGFDACDICYVDHSPPWDYTMRGFPVGEEFYQYLKLWLSAPSNADCPLGGKAPYGNAIAVDDVAKRVTASHFRTSHTPLHSQRDFIDAYKAARRISDEISRAINAKVFPYSPFYIFFEQYLSIVSQTVILLMLAFTIITLAATVILGSIRGGLILSGTVALVIVNIIAIMAVWGVSLNAVSLVNLNICVGIAVEFCSHIVRAYMFTSQSVTSRTFGKGRDRDDRVWDALTNVGSSVFTGILSCKFIGIVVLAFTKSKIFEIYYFRMWMALVVSAGLHALVLLPVILSYIGPESYKMEGQDSLEDEWMNDASRRYTEALLSSHENDYDDT